jgi:hypothetical protein
MKARILGSYIILVVVIIATFLISLNFDGLFTLEEMGLYLTVTGLIYGLIAAFSVSNVWEKFSAIRATIGEEIGSLINLHEMSRHFSDKTLPKKLGKLISSYCDFIVSTPWSEYHLKQLKHPAFQNLFNFLGEIKTKDKKDNPVLFQNLIGEIQNISAARTHQLTLASHGISKLRWFLLLFLSASVIIGLLLTITPSGPTVSAFANTVMTAVILLILVVIYDLDMLQFEVEIISNKPYREVKKYVKG